jgi:lipoyl-dependent peroxiredoxin
MAAIRKAEAIWEQDLVHGNGRVKLRSNAIPEFLVTWASRIEQPAGKTSPEELLAAAQAACYAMALSATLTRKNKPPERLDASAECTFDEKALKVTTMSINVTGKVPGMEETEFEATAREAEKICPVANAIRNNVKINLSARLG